MLIILLETVFLPVSSQTPDSSLIRFSESISRVDLQRHVRFLASDEMMGRKPGQRGIEMAADYLVRQFEKYRLTSPDACAPPYMQPLTLTRDNPGFVTLIAGTDTLKSGGELMILGHLGSIEGLFPLVFTGYGLVSDHHDDYTGLTVSGKVVAYLMGEPRDRHGRSLISGSGVPAYDRHSTIKDSIAYSRGAIATIRIDPSDEMAEKMIRMYQRHQASASYVLKDDILDPNNDIGSIYMGISDASRIFGMHPEKLRRQITRLEKGKRHKVVSKNPLELTIGRNPSDEILTHNIAGFVEGSELAGDVIVVTAHYDHLGKSGDRIYYGADDNATGTAALLEIAEAFSLASATGYRPKRSILFLPVTAEEMGLLGSRFYVENPLVPLDKTVLNINLDMLGRSEKSRLEAGPYVYVFNSAMAESQTGKILDELHAECIHDIESVIIDKSDGGFRTGGSDHVNFEMVNVPVIYFFNGLHPDYHLPSDTWDKIDYEHLTQTSRFVFKALWKLANVESQLN